MLEAHVFALVDRLAASECRRRGLRSEDAEELRALARLRFAERGEEILARHDGRSSLETYLNVVIVRLLHDWRRAAWGTWRPSAEAIRLGDVAIRLEERLIRDGEPLDRVAAELRAAFGDRASPAELERIRTRLPLRHLRPVETAPVDLPQPGASAETSLLARERGEVARKLGPLLSQAIRSLEAIDLLVLSLIFRDGLSVRAAARALSLDNKRVGRRLERVLDALRRDLERGGVDRHGVLLFLEGPEQIDENFSRDSDAPRPSTGGVTS